MERIRRLLYRRPGGARLDVQDRREELLHQLDRTLSLEELLNAFPPRIAAVLSLNSFRVYLLEGAGFVRTGAGARADYVFSASCSTVYRMKRDSRPAVFDLAQPDGWIMLATPEEIDALKEAGAQWLLPLAGRTGLMGFATLSRPVRTGLAKVDLRFLRALGRQMGHALETARMVERLSAEAVRRARASRELELAREVQERLLPVSLPHVAGLDVAAAYRPLEEVGGDYYDVFLTPAGRLCCVVADLSGKGVSSALLMATLRAAVHSLVPSAEDEPIVLVTRLNALLYQSSSSSRYATLFLLLYDPMDSTLTYVNAGHNPPLLVRAGGEIVRLACGGPVVGLLPAVHYDRETLPFAPGDLLVAYTDGLSEAQNPAGREWEEAGLTSALRGIAIEGERTHSSADTVDAVLQALGRFTAGTPHNDDLTLLALRRTET